MKLFLKKVGNKVIGKFRALRWYCTNKTYAIFLKRLRLTHTLPSGIPIRIASFADWGIYNEIFVDGEYDVPIRAALGDGKTHVRILDLGANVGFFLKRVLHIRRTEYPHVSVEIICVEGAPSTFAVLSHQLPDLESGETVRTVYGLAGKKTGSAVLVPNAFHAMTSLSRNARSHGIEVQFINLDEATKSWPQVDLLKCDIEGAEELIFENYADLLAKTTRAVIEFHLFCINYEVALSILCKSGLSDRKILHCNEHTSVEFLERKKLS